MDPKEIKVVEVEYSFGMVNGIERANVINTKHFLIVALKTTAKERLKIMEINSKLLNFKMDLFWRGSRDNYTYVFYSLCVTLKRII